MPRMSLIARQPVLAPRAAHDPCSPRSLWKGTLVGMHLPTGFSARIGFCFGLVFQSVTLTALLLGGSAALLIGFSKTGIPGAGMPAIALMSEAFPENTKVSVGAMVPLLILGDIFAVFYYRRHANWSRLAELVPYVVIGMIPGYWVLKNLPSDWLRVLIGVIILGLLLMHYVRERMGRDKDVPHGKWFVVLMGFLAGFGTVVGNAAGPAMAVYFLAKKLDKHEFIGTAAWFFFCVNLSKVPFQWKSISAAVQLDLCVAPFLVAGAFLGVAVHKRIPQHLFNRLVLALATVGALRMVGAGTWAIFAG